MNTSQKGSAAVTALLIIVLLVAAGTGAYLYLKQEKVSEEPGISSSLPDTQDTTVPAATTTETDTPALPPRATASPVTKVYTDSAFGFSTTYPKTYTASTDAKGKVTLSIPGSGIDPVTIITATDAADTSTGKWGKNVLSYSTSGWVTQLQNEQDGSLYTTATVPFAYTSSGLPIFNGGTRHGFGLSVYVVALSQTKFLIVSGPEGLTTNTGYDFSTDPTLQVAKATALTS